MSASCNSPLFSLKMVNMSRPENMLTHARTFTTPTTLKVFQHIIDVVTSGSPRPGNDVFGHGTGMAGLVAGAMGGVYKHAEIVPVKTVNDQGVLSAWRLIQALYLISLRQRQTGSLPSVVCMAINFEVADLVDPITGALADDPLRKPMEALPGYNVVVVMSAGNLPDADIGDRFPRRYGGIDSPFIVVGGTDSSGRRLPTGSWKDKDNKGLLSLYAMGQLVLRPAPDDAGSYYARSGSSPATAMTAGLAAMLLAQGKAVTNIKSELQVAALTLKGVSWPTDDGFFGLSRRN